VKGGPILVVEDDALSLELVTAVLTAAGYAVDQARRAEEAFAAIRRETPALVLLDLGLPGTDGLAVVRALRADPGTQKVAVIAVTARAMPSDEVAARAAGCDGYITKPIDTRRLLHEVARYLGADGGRA
jgi:DNA-binding response OmpR family regulator